MRLWLMHETMALHCIWDNWNIFKYQHEILWKEKQIPTNPYNFKMMPWMFQATTEYIKVTIYSHQVYDYWAIYIYIYIYVQMVYMIIWFHDEIFFLPVLIMYWIEGRYRRCGLWICMDPLSLVGEHESLILLILILQFHPTAYNMSCVLLKLKLK